MRFTHRRSLLASCLLPVALSAWAHPANASQSKSFSGMYNPTTQTQYDGVALYGSTHDNTFTSLTLGVFASVAKGANVTLGPTTVSVPDNASNLRVSVFSLYGGPTSSTVTLVLDSNYAASIGGTTFGNDFVGPDGKTAADEATIASDIQGSRSSNANTAAQASMQLEAFFNQNSFEFPLVSAATNTASGTIVTFSNAAAGGSASLSLSAVPEPSTYALLGVAGMGLGLLWRRRQAA